MFWLKLYLWIWLGLWAAAVLSRGRYLWEHRIASLPTRATKLAEARNALFQLGVAAFFWPVTLPVLVWILIGSRHHTPYEPPVEPRFAPTMSDLDAELTIESVEEAEIYSDPLDAVPQIPFGHLNGAWRKFRDGMSLDATLWRYEARWENNRGGQEIHSGYADVRDGAVIRFFDSTITHERI